MGNFKFGVQGLNQPKLSFEDVDFILTERVWDDFGFRTFYDITATSKLLMSNGDCSFGTIRIVANKGGLNYLSNACRWTNYTFTEIPEDFISVPSGKEMVYCLFCILTSEERMDFIKSMHLYLGKDDYLNRVEESVLNSTIFRFSNREALKNELNYSYKLMHSDINGKEIFNSVVDKIKDHL